MKQFKRVGSAVRRGSSFLTPKSSPSTPGLEPSEADLIARKLSPSPSIASLSQVAQAKPDSRASTAVTSVAQSRAESPVRSVTEQANGTANSSQATETPVVPQNGAALAEPVAPSTSAKDISTVPATAETTQTLPIEVPPAPVETPIPSNTSSEQAAAPPPEVLLEQPIVPSPQATEEVPPLLPPNGSAAQLKEESVPQTTQTDVVPQITEDRASVTQPTQMESREPQLDQISTQVDDAKNIELEVQSDSPLRMTPEEMRRAQPLSPIEEVEDDRSSIAASVFAAVPTVVVDRPVELPHEESNVTVKQNDKADNISEISDDGTTPRGGVVPEVENQVDTENDPQFQVPVELSQGKVMQDVDSYFVGVPVTETIPLTVEAVDQIPETSNTISQPVTEAPVYVASDIQGIPMQRALPIPIPVPQPVSQGPHPNASNDFPFIAEDPFRDPDPPIEPESYNAISYANQATPESSYQERRSMESHLRVPVEVPLPPLHEVTSNRILRHMPSDYTLTARSSRAPSINRMDYNEHSPLLGGRGVNLENDVNAIWPAPVAEYTTLGWTEHMLPDMRTYYTFPRLHVITDTDIRDKRKLKAVTKYIRNELQHLPLPPDGWELWLRDVGNTRYGFAPVHNWVNHNARSVSFDPPDRFGTEGNSTIGDDKLDLEYRYWSFMETHPAHAPLPSSAHRDALDALTWSYTGHTYVDRILISQDSTPLPFNQDECQRLMSVMQSLEGAQSSIQALVHTRVVSRILLRVAHWRQKHFRPEKPLPHDTTNSVRDGYSWSTRRTAWDTVIAWICFGIPYYFASRNGYMQYDEESGMRTVAPMLMFGASVCLVAAILMSASVTFLALPGLDNIARTAGFVAILAAAASLGSSLLAFYRQQAELQHWGTGGEGLLITTRGSVILSLPAVFLIWSILAFTTGVICYSIRGISFIDSSVWTEHFANYTWWTAVGVLSFSVGVLLTTAFFLRK